MTRNTIFENEMAKIWIDEFAPLVFVKLKKVPETEKQASKIKEAEIGAIKQQYRKFRVAFTINDMSEIDPGKNGELEKFCTRNLSDQHNAGLIYAAYLTPGKANGNPVEKISLKRTDESIGLFGSFEQAMSQVNNLWSYHIRKQQQFA